MYLKLAKINCFTQSPVDTRLSQDHLDCNCFALTVSNRYVFCFRRASYVSGHFQCLTFTASDRSVLHVWQKPQIYCTKDGLSGRSLQMVIQLSSINSADQAVRQVKATSCFTFTLTPSSGYHLYLLGANSQLQQLIVNSVRPERYTLTVTGVTSPLLVTALCPFSLRVNLTPFNIDSIKLHQSYQLVHTVLTTVAWKCAPSVFLPLLFDEFAVSIIRKTSFCLHVPLHITLKVHKD